MRQGRVVAVALLVGIVVSACGSTVDEKELKATNKGVGARGGVGAPAQDAAAGSADQPVAGEAASVGSATGATGTGDTGVASGGVPGAAGSGGAPSSASTGGGAAATGSRTGTKSEILLGSFGTGTGLVGQATAIIPPAVRAWAAELNTRGGLAGHPVRVVFADDGGSPDRALAIARQMVEQDGVLGFVGTYLVTTTPAVTPYLEQKQVPLIGAPGGNEIEDRSPMVFNPQYGADAGTGWAIVLALTSQSTRRKVGLLYCVEASACANQEKRVKEFAPRVGVKIVYEAQVSIAQPDYTAQVLAARNAGADAMVISLDPASIVRVEQSAHRQGWFPQFGDGYNVNNEALARAGKDAEGTVGMAATVPYSTSPLMKPYRDAMARYQPDAGLGGYGSTAWTQGKLWERIAPFLGDAPTHQQVLDGLYSLKGETLGGLVPPITFPKGAHGNVNLCGVPIKIAGGKITAPLGDHFVCAPK